MQKSILLFLKFTGKELINPVTYLVAFLIGATINAAQGNSILFSAVPNLKTKTWIFFVNFRLSVRILRL
jgi:hypothetical protein